MRIKVLPLLLMFSLGCSPLLAGKRASDQKQSQYSKRISRSKCSLSFDQFGLCAEIVPLQETISIFEEAQFQLVFWKKGSSDQDPYFIPEDVELDVWLWMKMGSGDHGSDPVTLIESVDEDGAIMPGSYVIQGAVFTMPGKWEIHVSIKSKDGSTSNKAVKIIDI